MGERAFERVAQVADPGADRAVAGAPTAGLEATMLSLQRTAGNAAVGQVVRDRQVLARWGGGRCSGGGSCGTRDRLADEELLGAGRSALKRAVAARAPNSEPTDKAPTRTGRRQLQRVPWFVPLPGFPPSFDPAAAKAWTTKVPCTGFTK